MTIILFKHLFVIFYIYPSLLSSNLVTAMGVEPNITALKGLCPHLFRRCRHAFNGAGDWNRTNIYYLRESCSSIELHQHFGVRERS